MLTFITLLRASVSISHFRHAHAQPFNFSAEFDSVSLFFSLSHSQSGCLARAHEHARTNKNTHTQRIRADKHTHTHTHTNTRRERPSVRANIHAVPCAGMAEQMGRRRRRFPRPPGKEAVAVHLFRVAAPFERAVASLLGMEPSKEGVAKPRRHAWAGSARVPKLIKDHGRCKHRHKHSEPGFPFVPELPLCIVEGRQGNGRHEESLSGSFPVENACV